jgi:uncharacterized protein (DUF736 family)
MPSREYDNNMRGVLFKAREKRSEKSPDYKGSAEINGIEYWVSGWKEESRSGEPYLSLSFQEKEQERDTRPARSRSRDDDDDRPSRRSSRPMEDDDIPF